MYEAKTSKEGLYSVGLFFEQGTRSNWSDSDICIRFRTLESKCRNLTFEREFAAGGIQMLNSLR
jgi:hypothetical protein